MSVALAAAVRAADGVVREQPVVAASAATTVAAVRQSLRRVSISGSRPDEGGQASPFESSQAWMCAAISSELRSWNMK